MSAPQRTAAIVADELLIVSSKKTAAVEANDFGRAAMHRDEERKLQQEWHSLGGPRPGFYRVRLDGPNGSHVVSEALTRDDAISGIGCRNVSVELAIIARAAGCIAGALELMRVPASLSSSSVETASQSENSNRETHG